MATPVQHVTYMRYGDPADVIELTPGSLPPPLPSEVQIAVKCCSLNPVDYKLMEGKFKAGPKGFPLRVGTDCSGVISAVGSQVSSLKVGDEVYCDAIFHGPLSTHVNVPSRIVSLKPPSLSYAEACTLPLAGLTALQGLRDLLKVGQPGSSRVLILGGSGGVGSLAIQMAKAMGAKRVATTSTNEELCKSLGADAVVDYKKKSIEDSVSDIMNSESVKMDVIFDTVGGHEQWKAAPAVLKKGGRFATIVGDGTGGFATIVGQVVWRKMFSRFGYDIFLTSSNSKDLDVLSQFVAEGKLKPVIDDTVPVYPFTEAGVKEAFAKLKTGRCKGKLVIKVAD